MITATSVTKQVGIASGELSILKGIDLEIKAGESVAIVGVSGSGKSTLLGLLAGLDDVSGGHIYIDGEDITVMDEEQRAQLRSRLVGFVFQSFNLLPGLTALENVMLPLELQKRPDAEQRAHDYLVRVGLASRASHYPKQLSGGEQQRVAIARAFVAEPRILFADEPTGNLDKDTASVVIDLLFELNRQNHTTLVLVTHDEALASRCQRQLRMDAGRLQEQGGGVLP